MAIIIPANSASGGYDVANSLRFNDGQTDYLNRTPASASNRDKFTLTSDMIKENAIVIDVAISRFQEKLVGDSDYDQIIQKASFATPVPGGVGPMTVAMLLKNTITAASLSTQIGR